MLVGMDLARAVVFVGRNECRSASGLRLRLAVVDLRPDEKPMDSDPTSSIPESQGAQRAVEVFMARNGRAKDELRQLVSTGNAFLLVGAGSSKRLGYPLWGEFLLDFFDSLMPGEQAAVNAAFNGRAVRDVAANLPLKLASTLERVSKERRLHAFRQFIPEVFGRQILPSEEHLSLLNLPFKGVLTPNFDSALESTLDDKSGRLREEHLYSRCMDLNKHRNELFRFLHPPAARSPGTRLVLHLHGVYDCPDDCVISPPTSRAMETSLGAEICPK